MATEGGGPGKEARPGRQVFDRAALLELLDGDESLCKELLDTFLMDMAARIDRLERALEEEDLQVVRGQAHTIKGTSANMCAHALSRVALDMEMAGRDSDLDLARSSFMKLQAELQRFRMALSCRDTGTD